jgi:UDP-GlcNAc:undecaprenyl-phosphate GlcNAc-1-phosphate transferase
MPVYAGSVVAFLITSALLLALRPLASSIGLLDHPGGHKTHSGTVPVIGGIAMLGGLLIAAVLGGDLGHYGVVVLLAAVFMAFIGALDDRFNLAPQFRLFAHAGAAIALVYGTKFVVPDLGNLLGTGDVGLGWGALPFTVIACMALINAFNMLDGLDGLAGGCGLVAFAGLSAIAVMHGAPTSAVLAASMLGACVGFLVFNLPARFNRGMRTFMGDAGSTLLGFVLACIGLILVQPTRADIPPVFILWMMPIPIFELFTTTARRLLRGHSPVRADDGHFHNRFVRAGFSVRLVFSLYAGVSLLSAWAGVEALESGVAEPLMFGFFVGFFILWLAFVRLAPAIGARLPVRLRRQVENLPI